MAGLIHQTGPDLILLDYNIPSLMGDDLCAIIVLKDRRVAEGDQLARMSVSSVNKAGKEVYIQPVIEGDSYRFTIKLGNLQGCKLSVRRPRR